jgi:hypothetical protein
VSRLTARNLAVESECRSTVTLAAMHGCSRARIYQQLALAELCPEIQADLDATFA